MQKKNREGFTLIELLAVIVILAIIALIAVPVIMNVITKARISAFEDSAYGIVKAGEMYYTNKLLDAEGMTEEQEFKVNGDVFQNTKNSTETLDLSGSMPKSGKVTVTTEGKVAIAISNGEYCIRKATTESSVKAEKLSDLGGTCTYKTAFVAASDGTEVPACIKNNTTCSAEDIKNGLKVGVQVNTSETKDFYVMSEDAEKGTVTLIMNQNLGDPVAWASEKDYGCGEVGEECSKNDKGPLTALKALESRTSSWTNIPLETYTLIDDNDYGTKYSTMTITARARLITYSEAIGFGCNKHVGSSCPSWLYEDLSISNNQYGYWTSASFGEYAYNAWHVYGHYDSTHDEWSSYLASNRLYNANDYGIRPVITISKTIL